MLNTLNLNGHTLTVVFKIVEVSLLGGKLLCILPDRLIKLLLLILLLNFTLGFRIYKL